MNIPPRLMLKNKKAYLYDNTTLPQCNQFDTTSMQSKVIHYKKKPLVHDIKSLYLTN